MDRRELIKARFLKRKKRLEWERDKAQAEVEGAARKAALRRAIDEKVPSPQSWTFTKYPQKHKPPSWR